MMKQKIRLTKEMETLLIPLLGKAEESRRPVPILSDQKAEEILKWMDYDFELLKAPRKTLLMMAMRARQMDNYTRAYLQRAEQPLVLHLGCGLDARVLRTGFHTGAWYDLDYPDVIALRREFYPETGGYHMLESSVTAGGWLEHVEKSGQPALIVAEGLLMYLREEEVKELLLRLKLELPGSELVCDVFSTLTARSINRHPSIRKTGAHVHWGIDDSRQLESWQAGIELLEEWSFSDSDAIPGLGLFERFMFRSMGLLEVAKKAHRILRLRL